VVELKPIKIIIGGLDFAGKTSILTVFDKRYNFQDDLVELQPTILIDYRRTEFLGKEILWWDMGGQERYRELYKSKQEMYFSETDLLIYVIDIQDSSRFEISLGYMKKILKFFKTNEIDVPLIVVFHKFDPELKDDEETTKNMRYLTKEIINIEELKMLFIQTSIYDILSIVQLLSSVLSIFYEQQLELKGLFEKYLRNFNCESLILFDENGVIISEYYTASLDFQSYIVLMKSIKEHIVLLKKMQEGETKQDSDFTPIDKVIVSYLHQIEIKGKIFYLSATIKEQTKEDLKDKIPGFLSELIGILEPILT
jgi:small GTP-binding protein